jgi:Rad3-related DNA helicase
MAWSLIEGEKSLEPLRFSNNKTQEDIVNEVISAIKLGHKIIFIKGVCGTGKSAIALNIAKELGRASIVVPVKALQKQYADDYLEKKYLLKENGEKLKISVLTGRQNFECPFINERKEIVKKEKNAKIDDFFRNLRGEEDIVKINQDKSCASPFLPCMVELKDKNAKIIRQYLKENPRVKLDYFSDIGKVKRMSIAPICPYWSPIVPADIEISLLKDAAKKEYIGLKGRKYNFYHRKAGCGYYDQYQSYIDSDVLIFNSLKYKLEVYMNRKPETEVEIIDECDEFLDSFANTEKINLNRLLGSLGTVFSEDQGAQSGIIETAEVVSNILKDEKTEEYIQSQDILQLKETKVLELIRRFLDSKFMNYVECDEENYCYHCDEVSRMFENFIDETYVSFHRDEKNVFVRLVTVNLEKKFKELVDKSKAIVMMSGTIHSESVLREIFGINNFKIIEAEAKLPGKVIQLRTGCEINCKYENFRNGKHTRKQYLQALNACVNTARKPILVHVNSFGDLPSEQEVREFGLDILTRQQLYDLQNADKQGEAVQKFKKGEISILYSTKCNRGIDFPGNICNSIVMTKYPYPNISSLFWKILKKTKPEHYNSFYIDKAKREFLQRIYRAVRSEHDSVYLLSPDIRCFA